MNVYSSKFNLPYQEITQKNTRLSCRTLLTYLNLVNKIVKKIENFKTNWPKVNWLWRITLRCYQKSEIKLGLQHLIDERVAFKDNIKNFLESNLTVDIDVNIMTKVDKDNFIKDEQLPTEFNDAHASLVVLLTVHGPLWCFLRV
jgi:hypothetical protein